MAMRSVEDRIRNYTDGVIPERVKEDFTTKKPIMVAKITDLFNQLTTIEDRVKGVLSGESVATCDYVKYHCFAREVWKKQRRFGGGTGLIDEVALLVAKWRARGCTDSVLTKIRNEVFALQPPSAP
ncbi:MAG: hypothetical protein ABIK62_00475 [candidate division WOR-3 bacterium]